MFTLYIYYPSLLGGVNHGRNILPMSITETLSMTRLCGLGSIMLPKIIVGFRSKTIDRRGGKIEDPPC